MAKKTNVDRLAEEITSTLDAYFEKVDVEVYRAGYRAIKELEDKTINTAPIYHRAKFRDHIATKSSRQRLNRSEHLWYVKAPEHRLTHLLVHGHATRSGGRTRPNPFLENALRDVLKKYEKSVEEAVKK